MNRLMALFALAFARCIGAQSSDPLVYDPAFNGGFTLEDRFAATTSATYLLGLHVALAGNGDTIVAGLVPPAFQSAPANNLGLVRYGPSGERVAWSNPDPAYAFFGNRYIAYPNSNFIFSWVDDVKIVDGRIYVLTDVGALGNARDVVVMVFDDSGHLVQYMPAFSTGLDEAGAALLPNCYVAFIGGPRICRLVATATYTTGSSREIVTMKRFTIAAADGSLSVDNSFGVSNNGAIDHAAPDALCDAGSNCSWSIRDAVVLRGDTNAPTFYLAGTVSTSASASDAFVLGVNGYDGSLETGFGAGSGHYVNYLADASFGSSVAATTTGGQSSDVVYLASNAGESCGQGGRVTKLRAQVVLPGGTSTLPDFSWGDGGTRNVGGNPGSCGNAFTTLTRIALDGDRLVLSGYEYLTSLPDPLFAIVRASDGALTEFARAGFPARHADGSPWGHAVFADVAAAGNGRYVTAGYLYDAAAGDAVLFGTSRFSSDRIFGDGFD